MLDFEEFQQYVKDNIRDFLPPEFEDAEVVLNTVRKNNGRDLHAVNIRIPGSNITPNIYLESFYQNYSEDGMELDVCLKRLANLELEHMNPSQEFMDVANKILDVDFAREHVVMHVVNAEKNAESLKEMPHKLTEDLAIIYKIYLGSDDGGVGTVAVKNEYLEKWGISADELHEWALENSNLLMPATVQDMGSLLRQSFGDSEFDLPVVCEDEMMYVVSNERKVNGASSIIYSDALERLAEKLGTDLYVLPSSVHEIIAISTNFGTPEELAAMVREVNATQVSVEEQLSDHVYKYDAHEKTLSLADCKIEDLQISKVSEDKAQYEAVNTEAVSRPRHHR